MPVFAQPLLKKMLLSMTQVALPKNAFGWLLCWVLLAKVALLMLILPLLVHHKITGGTRRTRAKRCTPRGCGFSRSWPAKDSAGCFCGDHSAACREYTTKQSRPTLEVRVRVALVSVRTLTALLRFVGRTPGGTAPGGNGGSCSCRCGMTCASSAPRLP